MLLKSDDPKFVPYLRLYWQKIRVVLNSSLNYPKIFTELLRMNKEFSSTYRILSESASQSDHDLAMNMLLWEILYGDFSEECIPHLDHLLHSVSNPLYKEVHLINATANKCTEIFFEKFFDAENSMKLDQIAMCCRPDILFNGGKLKKFFQAMEYQLTPIREGSDVQIGREFLRRIPYLTYRNDVWYYELLDAAQRDPYNRAMLDFLQPDYEEALEDFNRRQKEEAERKKKTTGSAKRQHINQEITAMRPQSDYMKFRQTSDDGEPETLQLRDYQEELVENAIKGKDTIVCAPTGAGKTEVCIYVALHHMKKRQNEGKPSRVVMVVPKCVLVHQQQKRFHKYMKGEKYVDGFQGEDGQNTSKRRDSVLACDVVVMTPQILYNMLVSIWAEDHLSLCDFSLIIFDEVHHCDKQHTYKLLADLIKNCDPGIEKPQIMGLTASLLTATAASDESNSLMNIYRLLANFGAATLSIVRTYTRELEKVVAKPDEHYSKECDPESNFFADVLKNVIRQVDGAVKEDLVNLSKKRADGNFLKDDINIGTPGRLLERFIGRVNVLKTSLERLGRDGREKSKPIQACKMLLILAKTLEIDNLMPAKYAMAYLAQAMKEYTTNNGNVSDLVTIFHQYLPNLQKHANDDIHKPIIDKLESVIRDKFGKEPDSRCIIFVNERSTCKVLSDALNESQLFRDASDAVKYIFSAKSRGASSAATAQSQTDQKRTLRDFNSGNIKVLVSTSVLDEGLDVSSCNLIIKYNCASTVVSRIQKAGRARARGSESWFLCLNHSVATQEFNAIVASNMLKRCLNTIANNGPRALEQQVVEVMKNQRIEAENRKREEDKRKDEMKNNKFFIHCKLCDARITHSSYLYSIKSHVGCFDTDIWNLLDIRVADKGKEKSRFIDSTTQMLGEVLCIGQEKMEDVINSDSKQRQCGASVGKMMRYANVYIPTLSAAQVNFYIDSGNSILDNESQELGKNWKAIKGHFYMPEVCPSDFKDDKSEGGLGKFADSLEESVQINKFYELQRLLDKMEQLRIKHDEAKLRQQERAAMLANQEKTDWIAMDDAEEEEERKKKKKANKPRDDDEEEEEEEEEDDDIWNTKR